MNVYGLRPDLSFLGVKRNRKLSQSVYWKTCLVILSIVLRSPGYTETAVYVHAIWYCNLVASLICLALYSAIPEGGGKCILRPTECILVRNHNVQYLIFKPVTASNKPT